MLNFKGIRFSKFRHVYGQTTRREQCYEGMRITTSAHDSQFCAVNPKFVAVVIDVAGGGAFQVLPLRWTGKVDYHMGRVSGHNGPVTDLKWNPFNDNIIASASDDGTVKLWGIADDIQMGVMREWLCELSGHSRRVTYIQWHPTAEGILASAGHDCRIYLWNVSTVECMVEIDCHPDTIYSMSFNSLGNLLATTCKDKRIRLIDPRTGKIVQEGNGHEGTKSSKIVFLGNKELLFTTGFSRTSRRQVGLWSVKNMGRPLVMQEVDSSSGVMFPFYDPDLAMVYVAGKGDGNIRYYEVSDNHPYLHYLTEFQSRFPQRGMGVMPKRGIDTGHCEISRFYKVHTTQTLVEPISFIVPRKSETFQSDLYPPTAGPTPAVTAEEWLCGIDKEPIVVSLRSGFKPVTSKPVQLKKQPTIDGDKEVLIAADRNNERKFQFLSQITKADYRVVTDREDYERLNRDRELQNVLKQRLAQRQQSDESVLTSLSSPRRSDEDIFNGSPPPRSPGANSAPIHGPTRNGHHTAVTNGTHSKSQFDLPAERSPHSPLKIRRISQSPGPASATSADTTGESIQSELESSKECIEEGREECRSPSSGRLTNGTHSSEGSLDDKRPSIPSSRRESTEKTIMTSPVASPIPRRIPLKMDPASRPPLPSAFLPSKPPESKITRPGRIGGGPMLPREQRETTAHVKPFRISQTSLSSTKTTPPTSTTDTDKEKEKGSEKKETENQKQSQLYSAQCRRVRELMEEVETKDKQVTEMKKQVSVLTEKLVSATDDNKRQQGDMESLRYEIGWKDERIRYLEECLTETARNPQPPTTTSTD